MENEVLICRLAHFRMLPLHFFKGNFQNVSTIPIGKKPSELKRHFGQIDSVKILECASNTCNCAGSESLLLMRIAVMPPCYFSAFKP
jgi:hypothetical protein